MEVMLFITKENGVKKLERQIVSDIERKSIRRLFCYEKIIGISDNGFIFD